MNLPGIVRSFWGLPGGSPVFLRRGPFLGIPARLLRRRLMVSNNSSYGSWSLAVQEEAAEHWQVSHFDWTFSSLQLYVSLGGTVSMPILSPFASSTFFGSRWYGTICICAR